jgi:hypothetical protein
VMGITGRHHADTQKGNILQQTPVQKSRDVTAVTSLCDQHRYRGLWC